MAIEPIVIRFATAGISEVSSAFARVGSQLRKFEEQATRERERGARARGEATRRGMTAEERAAAKLARDNERMERQRTRDAQKEAQRREALVRRSSEMAGRYAAEQARTEIRDQQKVTRELEREEERRMRIRIRSSEMFGRMAAREAAQESRAAERSARGRGATGRRIGGIIGGSVGGLAGSAMSIAGATLGLGGGLALASAARSQLSDERAAALLVNSATQGGVVAQGANVKNILGTAGQVARETGMNRGELIRATQSYVAAAGADQFGNALGNMGFFAKLAVGTGTDINDITSAAGILQAQNKNLSQKDMKQMLLDLSEQGKAGAVEIKDLASLAGGLGATRGLYEGSVTENQRKLMALAQVTRTEGTSAEEAMIGVKDLGTQAVKKAAGERAPAWVKKLVDPKSGLIKGGPEQLIEQSLLATKGNLGSLIEVFDQKGARGFERLAPIFRGAGGGQAGIDAVRKEMAPLMGARGSDQLLNQQYQEVAEQPAQKLAIAFEKIRTIVEEKLEPHLEKFADKLEKSGPEIEKFINGVSKAVDFFMEHPFAGIGAVVLAAITKDLAAAGIGAGIKAVLERILSGAGGGGVPVPNPGGSPGAPGANIGNQVAATAGIAAAALQVEGVRGGFVGGVQGTMAGENRVAQIMAGIKSGKVSAADLAKIEQDARSRSSLGTAARNAVANALPGVDVAAQGLGLVQPGKSVFGGGDAATRNRDLGEAQEVVKSLGKLKDALDQVTRQVPAIAAVRSNAPNQPIAQRAVN